MAPMAPEGGNTKPPLPPRINAAKHWVFTLNNPADNGGDDMVSTLIELKEAGIVSEWIIGREGKDATPHFQGQVSFASKKRPLEMEFPKTVHWEKMKGNIKQAVLYCMKEGDYQTSEGYRNIKPGREPRVVPRESLRPWQASVVEMIEELPDDRHVHWFWEAEGGVGKTTLVRYLVKHHDALVACGKAGDMKYSIVQYHENHARWPDLLVFDIPRSSLNYVSYAGIEEIKNGVFMSSKYESRTVLMDFPHIICFANEEPQREKMSLDRWKIHHIGQPDNAV